MLFDLYISIFYLYFYNFYETFNSKNHRWIFSLLLTNQSEIFSKFSFSSFMTSLISLHWIVRNLASAQRKRLHLIIWKWQGEDQRQVIFKFVQRSPLHFTYFTLSRYQTWSSGHTKNHYFRRFCNLSLFIQQRFEFIYDIINPHKIFFSDLFSWRILKKEGYETFRLHKYVNVLQLQIIDIATVLYLFCKYLFTVSLGSTFVQYILLCSPGKWQHKLNYCFPS